LAAKEMVDSLKPMMESDVVPGLAKQPPLAQLLVVRLRTPKLALNVFRPGASRSDKVLPAVLKEKYMPLTETMGMG
jgi:hypothetical protein